jgi:hypothetical protein
LQRIVQWAKDHDSRVIFLLLGDNPVRTNNLRLGVRHIEKGQYEHAVDELRVAMRDAGFGSLARTYLAKAYKGLGMPNKADEVVLEKKPFNSSMGGHPIFLDKEYHSIMREVALNQKIDLVDARTVLAPGDYIDGCHFDEIGHNKVGGLLQKTIIEILREDELISNHDRLSEPVLD